MQDYREDSGTSNQYLSYQLIQSHIKVDILILTLGFSLREPVDFLKMYSQFCAHVQIFRGEAQILSGSQRVLLCAKCPKC